MSDEARVEVAYARPTTGLYFPTLRLSVARLVAVLGVSSPAVGLSLLVAYIITRHEVYPYLGFIWLAIGGCMAVYAFVMSVIGLVAIVGKRADPAGKRCFVIALVASVLSVPIAAFCVWVGGAFLLWEQEATKG